MGDVTFDEDMNEWAYDGIGDLTYEEAAEVAKFIKTTKTPPALTLISCSSLGWLLVD